MDANGVEWVVGWRVAEWCFGGLLVFIYARSRFSTPKRYAASTTIYRYRLAASLYCSAAVITYIVLGGILDSSPEILDALGFGGQGFPDELANVTGPILAALLLTTLMPHFPILKKLDEWLLNTFRDIGNIPFEVRVWRNRLLRWTPRIPDDDVHEFGDWAARDSRTREVAQYLRFDSDGSPQAIFSSKVLFPMYRVEAFSADKRYCKILDLFKTEFEELNMKFTAINLDAANYFALSSDTAHDEVDDAKTKAIREVQRNFLEKCDDFYSAICELIAYGLLYCELNQKGRDAKLNILGYPQVERHPGRLSVHQIVMASSMVLVVFLALSSFVGSEGMAFQRWIFIATMVAAIYGTSAFCAIFPNAGASPILRKPAADPPLGTYYPGFSP